MDIHHKLSEVLLQLRQSNNSVEDDTVLNKLHSCIHKTLNVMEWKSGLLWCEESGILELLRWCCNDSSRTAKSELLCLAYMCLASLVQTPTGLQALDRHQLLKCVVDLANTTQQQQLSYTDGTIFVDGSPQLGQPRTGKNAQSSHPSHSTQASNASNGYCSINSHESSNMENVMDRSNVNGHSDIINGQPIFINDDDSINSNGGHKFNNINSSVLSAALSVILTLAKHKEGCCWIISNKLYDSILIPSLHFPSIFVQRQSAMALAHILLNVDTEKARIIMTGIEESALQPSMLVQLSSAVLEQTTMHDCPPHLLDLLSRQSATLRLACLANNTYTDQLQNSLGYLKLHIAMFQYVGGINSACHSSCLTDKCRGHCAAPSKLPLLMAVRDLLVDQVASALPFMSCWGRLLVLCERAVMYLEQRSGRSSFLSMLARVSLTGMLLPVLLASDVKTCQTLFEEECVDALKAAPCIIEDVDPVNKVVLDEINSGWSSLLQLVQKLCDDTGGGEGPRKVTAAVASCCKGLAAAVTELSPDCAMWLLELIQEMLVMLALPRKPDPREELFPEPVGSHTFAGLTDALSYMVADGAAPAFKTAQRGMLLLLEEVLKRPDSGSLLDKDSPSTKRFLSKDLLMKTLCKYYLLPGVTNEEGQAVLRCLRHLVGRLDYSPTAVTRSAVEEVISRAVCHPSWEVRDSALELLATATERHLGVRWLRDNASLQCSVLSLLDADESYVRTAAAKVLTVASEYTRSPAWSSTAHAWCVTVLCGGGSGEQHSLEEDEGVTAAALDLLAVLHYPHRRRHEMLNRVERLEREQDSKAGPSERCFTASSSLNISRKSPECTPKSPERKVHLSLLDEASNEAWDGSCLKDLEECFSAPLAPLQCQRDGCLPRLHHVAVQRYSPDGNDELRLAAMAYVRRHVFSFIRSAVKEYSDVRRTEGCDEEAGDALTAALRRLGCDGSIECVSRGARDHVALVATAARCSIKGITVLVEKLGLQEQIEGHLPAVVRPSDRPVAGTSAIGNAAVCSEEVSPAVMCSDVPRTQAVSPHSPVRRCRRPPPSPTIAECGGSPAKRGRLQHSEISDDVTATLPDVDIINAMGTSATSGDTSHETPSTMSSAPALSSTPAAASAATVAAMSAGEGGAGAADGSAAGMAGVVSCDLPQGAEAVMEEVLDYSDLATLATLRRVSGREGGADCKRPRTAAIQHTSSAPLSDMLHLLYEAEPSNRPKNDAVELESELRSLLEDILLSIAAPASSPTSTEDETVGGGPSHHTRDCY